MATLTPKHDKIEPLRVPGYLFSQLLDAVEKAGVATDNSNVPSVRRGLFFRPEVANEFSDRIRALLDEDKFLIASFPNSWWVTKTAKVLTLNTVTASDVATYVNHPEYRHFYFGYDDSSSKVDEQNIRFDPISESLEARLADLSAFMKLSGGFWLHWS